MADTNVRGKNAIESNLKEDENDEFVSMKEDKKLKKTFLNKILKDLEENDKDTMVKKDNEVVNKKATGFASRFGEGVDGEEEADNWRKPATKMPLEERPKKRGFGSKFEDGDDEGPVRVVSREEPKIPQESMPKAQTKFAGSSKGFGSRFKDDDEEDKPVKIITKEEPKVELNQPKAESQAKGFGSRFKDDDDEEDKPRAFINKIKTITSELKPESKIDQAKGFKEFKKKNRIIEEDFSEDESDQKNDNQSNSQFNDNSLEFKPKHSAEK